MDIMEYHAAIERLKPGVDRTFYEDGEGQVTIIMGDESILTDAEVQADIAANGGYVQLRIIRNGLLAASDWSQLDDAPGPTELAWVQYRQVLRDLPANTPDPDNVVWPNPPA
jgi:hypothetical protein